MPEQDTELITLVDEEGLEHQFSLLDLVELEEHRYALLTPVGEEGAGDEEEEEAYVFRVETDEKGQDVLVDVEDEEEFKRVCAAFEDDDEPDQEEEE